MTYEEYVEKIKAMKPHQLVEMITGVRLTRWQKVICDMLWFGDRIVYIFRRHNW